MRPFLFRLLIAAVLALPAGKSIAQTPGIAWQKTLGDAGQDLVYGLQRTPDGGIVVSGTHASTAPVMPTGRNGYNVYVARLSATGTLMWQRDHGGPESDYGYAVRNTTDGGFVVCGSSNSSAGDLTGNMGGFDMWILKLSATGDIEWQTIAGGTDNEYGYDIQQTADSGYIVAGRTSSADGHVTENKGGYDMWLVKLSKTGAIQWQHTYGGTYDDNLMSVIQTADGGYIIAGDTYSTDHDMTDNHGFEDMWVAKISATGDMVWKRCYGGTTADYAQAIRATPDNCYIVAGGSNSTNGDLTTKVGGGDMWVLKLSATGDILWQKCYGSTMDDGANGIEVASDSGFIVSGWVTGGDGNVHGHKGNTDVWVLKLSATGAIQWDKCIGSTTGYEAANCTIQTGAGQYIMAGTSTWAEGDVLAGYGSFDIWIVGLGGTSDVADVNSSSVPYLFPNPTTGPVYIRDMTDAHITVRNMLSGILKSVNGSDHIDISDLPPGMYMVTATSKDGNVVRHEKVLKQ
ncbi:lipoprotein [Nemorincola caseinilytica]|uniref:Lipoprotein n=1 Tax=Nemorincola caseinilytica TaxID=2054315 RepID=A0ABP8N7Z8_9BACT